MSIIGTVFVIALIFGGGGLNALYHVLVGGVLLGAFFMATDWVTSAITPRGQVIFGVYATENGDGCEPATGISL